MNRLDTALANPNVRAFLRAIRLGEGTSDDDGYRRIVGGGEFDSFADHPRKRVWIDRYKLYSSAAGAYQFIAPTWDEMAQQYDLPDFSPENQDRAAVGLLIRRKALDDVIAGRIEQAIDKCKLEWASLPGSTYGQRTESLDRVLAEYQKWGGRFEPATEQPPAPISESKPVFVRKEPMDIGLMSVLLPRLVTAIPELMRQFGDGKVTERNAKAVETVLTTVQEVTRAPNVLGAVEAVENDQQARETTKAKLAEDMWLEVVEVGDGGVKAAREFASSDGEKFWLTGVFWVTVLLLPLVYMTAYFVFTGSEEQFSGELKAAIASSIVTGVLGGVVGFWLGLKFRTSRRAAAEAG